MKNLIEYLYRIDIKNIITYDNYFIIEDSSTNYLLKQYTEKRDFKYIIDISSQLNQNSRFCYKIKRNIYNEIISDIEGKQYYFLDIGIDYFDGVDFLDMLSFYNKASLYLTNNVNYSCNWDVLWESKLDYFSLHSKKNNLKKGKLNLLFYFYSGIAENALLYLKHIDVNTYHNGFNKVCFNHRRFVNGNSKLEFYDPFNFVIDFIVRDIAEYIKFEYYNDKNYADDLIYVLKTENLSEFSASLLYARIVYPSYFFDYYESGDEKLYNQKFFNTSDYEKFIKKTYELISSYVNIPKIDWL